MKRIINACKCPQCRKNLIVVRSRSKREWKGGIYCSQFCVELKQLSEAEEDEKRLQRAKRIRQAKRMFVSEPDDRRRA